MIDFRLEYSEEGAWAVDDETGAIYLITDFEMLDNEGSCDMKFRKIPAKLLELIRLDMV
jgi:hypothetical protein